MEGKSLLVFEKNNKLSHSKDKKQNTASTTNYSTAEFFFSTIAQKITTTAILLSFSMFLCSCPSNIHLPALSHSCSKTPTTTTLPLPSSRIAKRFLRFNKSMHLPP